MLAPDRVGAVPRPVSLLPALVAVVAGSVLALPAPTQAALAPEETDDPLVVTIDSLSPGEIPERGPVSMRGTVTNVSDERWRAINVHAFISSTPMSTSEEVAAATEVPDDAFLGDRIVTPGTFDSIGSLAPGETRSYSVRLRRSQIPVDASGVYWFGAHALGNTTEVRDEVADGRARTFLPLVADTRATLDTSLVVPVRRAVRHTRTGRVYGARAWARDLAPGGSLRALADLGAAAGSRPVTWVVDPAVLDAVRQLAAGNPARSLDDTVTEADDPDEPGDPTGSASPAPESDAAGADAEEPPSGVAAEPGAAWLDRMENALTGERVLALPYGDPDVSAVHEQDPQLLREARQRSGDGLGGLDVPTLPAVAPPDGLLSAEALAGLPDGTVTVLSDRMLPTGDDRTLIEVDDRRVLFATSGAAQGGPGPDDPLATIAMRQRILAEGAVRVLDQPRTPLLVLLPETWTPDNPLSFFSGLDVDWLDLTEVTSLPGRGRLSGDQLADADEERQLPAANVAAARELLEAGQTLANLLTNNDEVDEQIADEALTSLSYGNRRASERAGVQTEASLAWVEQRLSAVGVRAPPGVTLSGTVGGFATTVRNRLDHPVTLSLRAVSDDDLTVQTPATIDLAARGSQTVVLDARADSPGVHYVRLLVTDDSGAPLGSSAMLPVRSAQVSEVIWVILGVGVGLLFLAIAVRLVRRIRNERA